MKPPPVRLPDGSQGDWGFPRNFEERFGIRRKVFVTPAFRAAVRNKVLAESKVLIPSPTFVGPAPHS